MTDLTTRLAPDADTDLAGLREQLAARAADEGVLDVGWRVVDSPVGALLLAASDRGLVRVAFATEDHDAVLETLAGRLGSRVLPAAAALDPVARQLDDYFAGRRHAFDVAVDLRLSSPFRRRVQEALPGIGFGRTASYAELAARVGSPGAVRAVGSACATNPVPVVVPCHRVLRSDGSIGGYRGGPDAKRALLALEGG